MKFLKVMAWIFFFPFMLIGSILFAGVKSGKSNSRGCDGNCANCPPHYGYRYGRWYYGHSHSEGCTLGGNKRGGRR